MSKYAIEKNVPLINKRQGAKLDAFDLGEMEVGDSFLIPYTNRDIKGKTKQVPETGFNVKAANQAFAPKVFTKTRTAKGVRVHRKA